MLTTASLKISHNFLSFMCSVIVSSPKSSKTNCFTYFLNLTLAIFYENTSFVSDIF